MSRFLEWLAWVTPGLYLGGGLLAAAVRPLAWWLAAICTRGALVIALLGCGTALVHAANPATDHGSAIAWLVTALIAFLGWIVGGYSQRYLRGEAGQARFVVAYLITLGAVSTVVASPNLPLLIAAWAASSAGLHHLLTFYRERAAALIVAHKKFLASRLAEACLVVACGLLYREWGTLNLADISAHAAATSTLSWGASAAASLIAVAVLLKCAQLPLHGWLIQVMEAPTPVSALLHAGVVNIGGYVLIRLAPLIGASEVAQTLLVLVGSLTAALAGLVMLTRITIKVRLAWSTCSQMGLMVTECGLGLYDLALLHLLAHALYKAHAFLTAGEAVHEGLSRRVRADRRGSRPQLLGLTAVAAFCLAGVIVFESAAAWHQWIQGAAPAAPALTLLTCGLATLLWRAVNGGRSFVLSTLAVVCAAQIYLTWHWLFAATVGLAHVHGSPILAAWTIGVFLALYGVQFWVTAASASTSRRRLYDWAYAGFYLDERFTRLSFRLWPPRLPAPKTVGIHDPRSAAAEGLA